MICKIHTVAGWDSSPESGVREAIKRGVGSKGKTKTHLPAVGVKVSACAQTDFFLSLPACALKTKGLFIWSTFLISQRPGRRWIWVAALAGKRQHLVEKMLKLKVKNHATHGPGIFLGPKQQVGIDFLCVSVWVCMLMGGWYYALDADAHMTGWFFPSHADAPTSFFSRKILKNDSKFKCTQKACW